MKLSGGDKDERQAQIDFLTGGTGAEKIHQIGHVVVLFRRNTDEPENRPAALMDLSLDRPEGYLSCVVSTQRSVTLVDRELSSSFLLAPDRAIEDWPVR